MSVVVLGWGLLAFPAWSQAPSYAVVASEAVLADQAWAPVVDLAVDWHHAKLVRWSAAVTDSRAELARLRPRYTAFVARPTEVGRDFVVAIHRLTRALDDDPYGDTVWGILTGYEPADAMRMITAPDLVLRRALGTVGVDLNAFDEGSWFDDSRQGHQERRVPGEPAGVVAGPADPTLALADALEQGRADVMLTSGHATERDWQIGFGYRAGEFRSRDGVLLARPLEGPEQPIWSRNAKIFMPVGNCLIGHVPDPQALMLAWLHSGGAHQAMGYTVLTWFGYMGWGVNTYLMGELGSLSFADAFFANQQALLTRLAEEFPGTTIDPAAADYEGDQGIGRLAARLGYAQFDDTARNHVGLLWDRDTVAFYGDPAWSATMPARDLGYDLTVELDGDVLNCTVAARADVGFGRPPFAWLPERIEPGAVLVGAEYRPVLTDDFLLLPGLTKLAAGETATVTWRVSRR